MMISPQIYIARHMDDSFEQLIQERKELLREIESLEKPVFSPERTSPAWNICPGPDVQYQVILLYLAELCHCISDKYNREMV